MKKLLLLLMLLLLMLFGQSANAGDFIVDKAKSYIQFSGKHAGREFVGRFEEWDAIIDFDANALPQSSVEVTIKTGSAETGDAMYDGTLPNKDWFDVINHPKAIFKSSKISKIGDGFNMMGELTIKDVTSQVAFEFALKEQGGQAETDFSFAISRLKFGVGKESDGEAEWVDDEIKLKMVIVAKQK